MKKAAPAKADPVKKAKTAAPGAANRSTATVQQYKVEAQLAKGKVAVILFWDPKGAEDRVVHSALRSLRGDARLKIAVDEASAGQVASFGSDHARRAGLRHADDCCSSTRRARY